ncbi:MAG: tRNA 2-thiouridine(34) synthase MnmA, partial [Desulfonatronovibrio sp.]
MKIAVALSGGADSLASLLFLKDQGHDLFPFHARLVAGNDQQKQIEEQLSLICQNL